MSELKSSVSIIVVCRDTSSKQTGENINCYRTYLIQKVSIYSSNDGNKRAAKQRALYRATIEIWDVITRCMDMLQGNVMERLLQERLIHLQKMKYIFSYTAR